MSYTPTDWKTGDTIFAEQLNNMEAGIVGGQELLIIHATGVGGTPDTPGTPVLDKTYEEISDAIQHGKIPLIVVEREGGAANVMVLTLASFADGLGYLFYLIVPTNNNLLLVVNIAVGQNEVLSQTWDIILPDSTGS